MGSHPPTTHGGGPVQAQLTREELARLLREAEQAHAEYEKELGPVLQSIGNFMDQLVIR